MLPRITAVSVRGNYLANLTFSDGRSGTVDLRGDIFGRGGLFLDLQNPEAFAQVAVDVDAGTIAWPNGVDLDPDVLYARVTGMPLPHETASRAVKR